MPRPSPLGFGLLVGVVSWLAGGLTACTPATPVTPTLEPLAAAGQQVFNARCATCHALQPDVVIVGPALAGVATRAETRLPGYAARDYLEFSVLQPAAYIVEGYDNVMPQNFGTELTSEELNAVTAFLLTLK